jgi:hypothetical protein
MDQFISEMIRITVLFQNTLGEVLSNEFKILFDRGNEEVSELLLLLSRDCELPFLESASCLV